MHQVDWSTTLAMLRLVEPPFAPIRDRNLLPDWGSGSRLPRWLRRVSGRLAGVNRLREVYRAVGPSATPAEFAQRALALLDIRCALDDSSRARIPESGRTLFVANHPFGALDGLIAIAMLGAVRPDLRVLANSELALVPELAPIIYGVPAESRDPVRDNTQALRHAMRWLSGEHAVLTFPAGDIAHYDMRARCVTDPPWSPATGRLVQLADARVVPVHFSGANGKLFHVAGLLAPRVRSLLLPRELRRLQGARVDVHVSAPIAAARLARFRDNEAVAVHLRLKTLFATAPANAPPQQQRIEIDSAAIPAEMPRDVLATEVRGLPVGAVLLRQGDLDVYLSGRTQIPYVVSEIGRLREITFRASGAGSGRGRDLDRFDESHEHLFVWNRQRGELVGACRIARIDSIRAHHGKDGLHTARSFKFHDPALQLLGQAFELDRPFVRAEYRLDPSPLTLLWKGIGECVGREPQYCSLLGLFSVGADYSETSRNLMIGFLRRQRRHPWLARLVRARHPLSRSAPFGALSTELALLSNVEPLCALIEDIEPDGKGVPPLLRQYLNLGGRALGFNTDAAKSSIDCLMMVDLRHSKPRMLKRIMSEPALARFQAAHRLPRRPPDTP